MKKLVILFLLALCGNVNAGHQTKSFLIQFASDQHTLDPLALQKLEEVSIFLAANPSAKIKLTGRTDYDGSTGYNLVLSRKRTSEVSNYLTGKGWGKIEINEKWVGELNPLAKNSNESGKAMNRSVEILVTIIHYQNTSEWIKEQQKDYEKVYTLKKSGANTIITDNQTIIDIPALAFIGPDGKPVDNKNIKVVIKEVNSKLDAIINQVFTRSGDKLLETGGMISIDAYSNSNSLKLSSEKDIRIKIPSAMNKKDMYVFEGLPNDSGAIDWKNTGKPFAVNSEAKRVAVKLNEKVLESLIAKIEVEKPVYKNHDLSYTFPVLPKLPSKPKPPVKSKDVEAKELFSGLGWVFSTPKMKRKRLKEANDKRINEYAKRMEFYNKKFQKYEEQMAEYDTALVKYELDKEQFYVWASQMQNQIHNDKEEWRVYFDKSRVSSSLKGLLHRSINGTQYEKYPKYSFQRSVNNFRYGDEEHQNYTFMENLESILKTLDTMDYDAIVRTYSKSGVLHLELDRKTNIYGYEATSDYLKNNFIDSFTAANVNEFIKVFGDGSGEAAEMAARQKEVDRNMTAAQHFTGSIQNLGWINCDRFVNEPMVKITCPTVPGAYQVVVLTEINSVLNMYTDVANSLNYASIPLNQKFKLVTLKIIGDEGFVSIQEAKAKSGLNVWPKFDKVPLDKLNGVLAKL